MKTKLRITSGKYRNRYLEVELIDGLRPTQTKNRQAVFNMIGNNLEGLNFLDLFCGSGINGFEALSRNVNEVVWIDSNSRIIAQLKKNIARFPFSSEKLEVYCSKVDASFKMLSGRKFDIIYLDPPFIKSAGDTDDSKIYMACIEKIVQNDFLNTNGLLIIEFFSKYPINLDSLDHYLSLYKDKSYGSTGIRIYLKKQPNG
ncbi:MAG: methyltransferase [uncultured bacterium]|nr:MAG: methyltransferase [uncultured bacterium]